MAGRKQFTFYASFWETAKRIKSKAARADLYDTICRYALDGEEPDLDKLPESVAVAFINAKPNLDASRKKAESGKQGGSKTKANGKQMESKPPHAGSENEREKEEEKENEIEGEEEKQQGAPSEGKRFTAFWDAYPNKIGRENAWEAWKKISPDQNTAAQILKSLDAWKQSGQWLDDDGRFIPKAAKWLSEGYWRTSPAPAKQPIPKGASGQLGEAELEAIRRALMEDDK